MQSRATYIRASRLFPKALGIVYLIAFVSFGVQATALIGPRGILPAGEYLKGLSLWSAPTVFLVSAGEWALRGVCIAGAVLSIVMALGFCQRVAAALLFALYLSLVVAGQTFMSFQWDLLLLETGFLAIFLKPVRARVWLFQWLLFRLIFLSGAVKLLSGDATWRNLTAMTFHYETQPLPTPIAWYMQHLPLGFQRVSTAFVLIVETVLPFLIFGPAALRLIAAVSIAGLQVLIALTGNYTFFNALTIALCLFLIDDRCWKRIYDEPVESRPSRIVSAVLFCAIMLLSGFQLMDMFGGGLPRPAARVLSATASFGIVNTYGLFAQMTTSRPEIVVEGSNDAATWLEYEFRYKPGNLNRAPPWVAPHQPRLDWQMWFAALGNYQQNPWFVSFMLQLLRGNSEVLALMDKNPFPHSPPRYIRALVYDYHFTNFAESRKSGAWWRRELKGVYFPPVSLKPGAP